MNTFPLLSLTVFLPLLGAALLLLLRPRGRRTAFAIGIGPAALTLLAAGLVWARGVPGGFTQLEELPWIPAIGAAYRLGVDGVSLPLVLLTAVLFLATLIYSANTSEQPASFVALMLLLETACLGAFLALDLLLFYVFFEVTLVGMYFIIAGWGHDNPKQAALTFFIYTLVGSVFLLLAILALYLGAAPHTFDMRALLAHPPLGGTAAVLTFGALALAFAIKTPLFPFHTWLPTAHTAAPAAGSAILAGVLLKLGGYGFIRFGLQMTPDAFRQLAPYVLGLAVFSAIYGAFAALGQTDIKRMVAYTSVNHMGYVVFGVAAAALRPAGGPFGLDGAVLQMVSHGIVTGGLFLLIGALQDRTHTRDMGQLGGLAPAYPVLSGLFILASFASLGLPALAHFPAEFQIFLGGYQVAPVATALLLVGLIITTALYLRAIQRVFLGEQPAVLSPLGDLGARELWAIGPLMALIVLIGLYPEFLLGLIHATQRLLMAGHE